MAKIETHRRVVVCLALIAGVVCLWAGQPAFAKKGGGGGQMGGGPPQAPTSQPQNPQALAAQRRLQEAQKDLATVVEAFKKKYEDNAAWKSAADAQKSAQKGLTREHQDVLDKLSGTDEYKAAVTKKEQASADLEAAHADPTDADPQHTAELAQAVMDATQDKSKLENEAIQNDSGYAASKAKVDDANKTMADYQEQEKTAMEQEPDWQKAHQNLVDAQAAYSKFTE
jgi:chromosome segregation ATPase